MIKKQFSQRFLLVVDCIFWIQNILFIRKTCHYNMFFFCILYLYTGTTPIAPMKYEENSNAEDANSDSKGKLYKKTEKVISNAFLNSIFYFTIQINDITLRSESATQSSLYNCFWFYSFQCFRDSRLFYKSRLDGLLFCSWFRFKSTMRLVIFNVMILIHDFK